MTNRFKEFDLINRVSEKLWAEVHKVIHKAMIKRKINAKRQNSCLRRPYK